jgi:hypothetical protein
MMGLYRGDFAELESLPPPPWFGTLKSYWDSRDLTSTGGFLNPWPARDGTEQSSLVNLNTTAIESDGGAVGRMQVNVPAYTGSGSWSYLYVLKVPTSFSGYKGVSSYEGKPLQFFFDGAILKSARGDGGVFYEGLRTIADFTGTENQLLSLLVVHKASRIDFYWELDGVAGSGSYVGAATNAAPVGLTLGGFADSSGEMVTPFYVGSVINGEPADAAEAEALVSWGSLRGGV